MAAKNEEDEDTEITEEEIAEEGVEGEEEAKPKKKKTKKVVRRRKTKKEKEKPITSAIRLAVESGKVEFGARTGMKASLLGQAKLFVMASNTPSEIRQKVEQYCGVSKIPLIVFEGTSMELGSVCGKPFPVTVLWVMDPGASTIMDLALKQ